MNIISCCKVVPEAQDIKVDNGGNLSFEKASLVLGAYDLNAIEAGVQLAEQTDGKSFVLSVGGEKINDTKMKKSILSRGSDELFIVADEKYDGLDTYQTACILKESINKIGNVDLVICGEGSADIYAQQVGVQLGQLMDVAVVNSVSSISIEANKVIVQRTLENEVETIEVPVPAVISITSDINEPRIATMKQILAAGKKPTTVWNAADLGADAQASMEVVSLTAPQQTDRKQIVITGDADDNIQEFYNKIMNEIK